MKNRGKYFIVGSVLMLFLASFSNVWAAIPDVCAAGGQKGGGDTKIWGLGMIRPGV